MNNLIDEYITNIRKNPNDWRKNMDNINSINSSKNVSITRPTPANKENHQHIVENSQSDSFKNNSQTKKIVKYSAIIAGIGLAILAFIKRKQIGEFFSNLFKKKSNNHSAPSTRNNIPPIDAGNPPPPPVSPAGGHSQNHIKPQHIAPTDIPQSSAAIVNRLNSGACDEIATAIEKLQIEEIPLLVQEVGKAPKETQSKLLDIYNALNKKHCELEKKGLSSLKTETEQLGKKLYHLNNQMIEQNISFVPKTPKEFLSEAEKIKYIQNALHQTSVNEASALDALSVFEKYGSRYTYERGERIKYTENGMSDLYVAVSSAMDKLDAPIADKIMSKYIDIFNKIARTDGTYRDTRFLERFMTHNADKMSESTVNKLIDTLKKYSFESNQAWYARAYFLKTEFTKRTPEELLRIESKIKELEEVVKDMPRVDRTKPKGMSD